MIEVIVKLQIKTIQTFLCFAFVLLSSSTWAHGKASSSSVDNTSDAVIIFPDVDGRLTLISDLHTHSVFSDGHVWPNIRVSEAQRNGLDVLAITEHLEYQPHIAQIPHLDRNIAYEEAYKAAHSSDLLVIAGSEITRDMPPGHMNAIFVKDSNKLINLDINNKAEAQKLIDAQGAVIEGLDKQMVDHIALASVWPVEEALKEASRQGAFVFWNHPMWSDQAKDGIARLSSMHKKFIADGQLHGIEIVNDDTYSEEAFKIALDNDLTLIGTSDVHNLIEWDYSIQKGEHRPVTLIFTKERNAKSLREALFQNRTVVWFKDMLIGKEANMMPLLNSIIDIKSSEYIKDSQILKLVLRNNSSARLQLKNQSAYTFVDSTNFISMPANSEIIIQVKTLMKLDKLEIDFQVLNALITPKKNPVVKLIAKI